MQTRQAKLAAAVTATGIKHTSADASRRFAMLLFLFVILCPFALSAQTNFVYVNNQSGVTNNVASFSVDTGGVATSLGTVSTGGTGATVAVPASTGLRSTLPAICCLFPMVATRRSVCFASLRRLAL